MDTKTEAKNEIQEPIAPQVDGIDSIDQDGHHRGGLWVLAVALVAFAGLAAAVAIEVFDGSSGNDAVTTVYVDPRIDSDSHRTPGQLSANDQIPAEWDNDFHRPPGGVSPKDPVARQVDKDFQREANQAASQEEAAPYGSGLPHEAH